MIKKGNISLGVLRFALAKQTTTRNIYKNIYFLDGRLREVGESGEVFESFVYEA